jgi:hypothetical protein
MIISLKWNVGIKKAAAVHLLDHNGFGNFDMLDSTSAYMPHCIDNRCTTNRMMGRKFYSLFP